MRDGQTAVALITVALVLVLMLYVAISITIFRLRNRTLMPPKDPSPREHSFLLHYLVRQWWQHWASPIVRFLVRHHWHPNALTYLSLVFAVASGLLFALAQPAYAGLFLLLSGACDSLDGRLAREAALHSARGAFLDSSLDRVSEIVIFIGISAYLRESPFFYASLIALGSSLMVSYARARGQSLGVDFGRGLMQRAERIVYLGAGALLDPLALYFFDLGPIGKAGGLVAIAVAFVAILSTFTAAYRIISIAKLLNTK